MLYPNLFIRTLLSPLVPFVLANKDTTPPPISIPASQDWDGDDGGWSSFALQVGTPPQDVKVLIGTSAVQTLVVLPEGCISSDPSSCPINRGGTFQPNTSSTWIPNTASNATDLYALHLEDSLGYTGNGEYGFDTVTLAWQGSGGPTLKNQTVAGIATKEFYLGVFGLNPRPSNFTNFDDPVPSFMQNLRNQSMIPSTSWAYTAGNRYRLQEVLGSLTLGGYDASRFIPNNVTFPFNERDIRDLSVPITSIETSTNTTTTTLFSSSNSTPISAFIDSTVPYIYLPTSVCLQFESAFNITWNNETSLYLLDMYQQTTLSALKPSVTFTLSGTGGDINITLPFQALDLMVEYPLIENATYYIPLKRAENEDQLVLGRTFLQEAYLIADYDRRNFSVSACNWDASTLSAQEIIAIHPPSTTPHTTLPKAILIGSLASGVVLLLLLMLLVIYFAIIRPRRTRLFNKETQHQNQKTHSHTEMDMILKPELDVGISRYELPNGNSNNIHYAHAEVEGDDGRQHAYEMQEGGKIGELDVDEKTCYHEMPANEAVGAELGVGFEFDRDKREGTLHGYSFDSEVSNTKS